MMGCCGIIPGEIEGEFDSLPLEVEIEILAQNKNG